MTIIIPEEFDEEIEPTYIAVTSSDQVLIVPFKLNILHIINENAVDSDDVTVVCLGTPYNFVDSILAGEERYYSIDDDDCMAIAHAYALDVDYQIRVHIICDVTAIAHARAYDVTNVAGGVHIIMGDVIAIARAHGNRCRYKLVPGEEIIELTGYYEDIELTGEYKTRIDLTGWLG